MFACKLLYQELCGDIMEWHEMENVFTCIIIQNTKKSHWSVNVLFDFSGPVKVKDMDDKVEQLINMGFDEVSVTV